MKHPQTKAERRALAKMRVRSPEAKALEHFIPKKINAKKRQIKVQLLDKETENELASVYQGTGDQPGAY